MEGNTAADIISLPLNAKEREHTSRRRKGFHVFLSRYTNDLEEQDPPFQHEQLFEKFAIRLAPEVSDADSTHSDYSAQHHSLPYRYRMKIACNHWQRMSTDKKKTHGSNEPHG